ncbi:MAG: ATP-binding protein [Ruminococcus sp.]|nr:ATP-binding protein [Ruminococcus sp.]
MADTGIITRLFFRLLPVQIILVAVGSINSIIDGAIAGKFIGPAALSMIGLYYPMLKLMDTVNAVLVGGSQILCGQSLGRGELEKTRKIFSLDLIVTVAFSLLMTAAFLTVPGLIAKGLGADSTTADGLASYLRAMSFGIAGGMLASQLSVFLQLEQQEKRTYIGIGVMAALNISLNLLFVKVLDMGMFGLGLSTSISNWVFCIIQLSYYFTKKAAIRFELHGIEPGYLKEMLRIGIPGAVVQLCLTIRGVAMNKIILSFAGSDALAAYSAVGTFGCAYFAVTAGVASATRLLVSVYYGEEDRAGLLMIMKTALFKGVGLVAGVAAVSIALAGVFTGIFCTDSSSEVYSLTLQYFRMFPLSMPLSCVFVIFSNYYQCTDRMKIVNFSSVLDGVVGIVVTSLVLAPVLGAFGIWLSQIIAGFFPAAAILIYTVIVNRRLPRSIEDMLVLRSGFGVPEEDRMDISVRSEDDVLETSEAVIGFCTGHGLDYKRSYYSGLCIEEMAGNIVRHGFVRGRRNSVDIRVVLKDDRMLIRFKDTCKPFDPKEYAGLFTPEDKTHNIGIRMISRISTEMDYNYILGLNVLSISL